MKINKLLSIALAVLIVLSTIPGFVIFAEEEKNIIYSENIQAIAGESVLVPVKIKNNTGIAGFKLKLKYNNDYLTPIEVNTTSSILTQGLINDTIETSKDNTIDVLWSNTENIKDDGLLFYIKFNVNEQATDKTEIEFSYSQADTFDENIKDVVLNLQNITLSISNNQYDSLPQITLSGSKITAGEMIKISGVVTRKLNLSAAEISISYDKDSFDYKTIKSVNNSAITDVSSNDGVLRFKISNVLERTQAFEIEFKCSDYADSKDYLFSGQSNGIYIKPVKIKVNSSLTSDSPIIKSDNDIKGKFNEKLVVPIYINNNKGIMGYKLSFYFEKTLIKPVKIISSGLFSGNFENNIGLNEDKFDVVWSNTSELYKNGKIFDIEFEVLSQENKDSLITVSYSNADTFNEEYKDVNLVCNNISLSLNAPCKHKFTNYVSNNDATCLKDGTKTAECDYGCGETSTITDTGSKLKHKFTNYKSNNDATCLKDGTKTAKCDYGCGEKSTITDTGSKLKHKFTNYKSNNDATCLKDGTKTAECDYGCGEKSTITDTGSKLKHKFTNYKSNNDATCLKDGTETAKCDYGCGETSTITDTGSKLKHKFTNYKSNNDATCLKDGTKTAKCDYGCGETNTITDTGSKLKHKFTNYVSNNDATCLKDGTKTAKCDYGCGETNTITDTGSKLKHKFTNYKSNNDATCLKDGTKTAECDYGCGVKNTINDNGSKLSHIIVLINKSNPTYANDGYSGDEICISCKTVIKKGYSISKNKLNKPLIKLKSKKKKVIISIKKVLSAQKYEIQIKIGCKWKKFSSAKLKKIIKNKSIKVGKKYRVRVRAVVTENGQKYYSNYSYKKIKIKK